MLFTCIHGYITAALLPLFVTAYISSHLLHNLQLQPFKIYLNTFLYGIPSRFYFRRYMCMVYILNLRQGFYLSVTGVASSVV